MSNSFGNSVSGHPAARQRLLPWCVLALLLVTLGPLFVCMPLTADTALYDLQTQALLKGGTLYRDIVEPNFPGVVWIHLLVRSVCGWSTEAMRLFDLAMVSAILFLCGRLARQRYDMKAGPSGASVTWFIAIGLLFYVSLSEWCHCQRDTWMLLPGIGAVFVRIKNCGHVSRRMALMEGILWGVAFWIKPHIALVAIPVIASDVLMSEQWLKSLRSTLWIVAGGLIAGLPGVLWMVNSDTWPWFCEMMFEWNREYVENSNGRKTLTGLWGIYRRMHLWGLAHCVAIPLASRQLWSVAVAGIRRSGIDEESRRSGLLSVCYLSWLLQAVVVQHSLDYVHVPPVILGLTVVVRSARGMSLEFIRPAAAATLFIGVVCSPLAASGRLSVWDDCLMEGSTPATQASLSQMSYPDREAIAAVADFLKGEGVGDGEVSCLNGHSVHILHRLQIQPSSRYWCMWILQGLFSSHSAEIEQSLVASGHRFVVTDSIACDALDLDTASNSFPWNLPIVFESGAYQVRDAQNGPRTATASVQMSHDVDHSQM